MKKYQLAINQCDQLEIDAAKRVLDSGHMTMGENVAEFEHAFSNWLGSKYAVMVNSGSSANLLMFEALLRPSNGRPLLQKGDKVIVPALAWPTTVWPIVQLGMVPVFVDIDPKTLAIDLASAASVMAPDVKGMFLINVLGQPPELPAYQAFCQKHGLVLLEDNCESLGAKAAGRFLGTFGKMASFSLYFSHHISTIEGGIIVTDDHETYNDLLSARSHGWTRDRTDRERWNNANPHYDSRFVFAMTGYNLRPTEIQAAIGLVQLKKLHSYLDCREDLARFVKQQLEVHVPFLELIGGEYLDQAPEGYHHSWMTLPFIQKQPSNLTVKQIIMVLEEHGVECRPIISGNLVRHPACRLIEYETAASLAQCDRVFKHGLMIGCHATATQETKDLLSAAFTALGRIKP